MLELCWNCVKKYAKYKNNMLFIGNDQNDMSEFFLFLFEGFHDCLKKKVNIEISGVIKCEKDKIALKCYKMLLNKYNNDYSSIIDLFYGTKYVEITDTNNKSISLNPEVFLFLDLYIPKKNNITLYDCLDNYFEEEILSGDNKYYYEIAKKKK